MSFRMRTKLLASGFSLELIGFSFTADSAAGVTDPLTVEDGDGNTVAHVYRTAAGKWSVQLHDPLPRELVVQPMCSCDEATGATTVNDPHYVAASYSTTTGTFAIENTVNDGSPAIGDPADGSIISVLLIGQMTQALT